MFIIKYIFFDTETTGLNCRFCRIIELAMLTVVDGKVVDEYDKFVNVGRPLDSKITRLTGITDQDLLEKGVGEEEIANDLKEKLTEKTVMVAHNAQFDLSFIYYLLKRHFPAEADEIVRNVDWIDTVTVLKDRKNYPHKLIDAVEYYDIEKVNFHRAIDDTKALYYVALAMKNERDDLEEYKNIFGYNPKFHDGRGEFPFIEYRPQPYHNCGLVDAERILPRRGLNQRIR